MNGEQFHFLSDAKFSDMSAKDRVAYLVKAGKQVEERWQELASKAQLHAKLVGRDK